MSSYTWETFGTTIGVDLLIFVILILVFNWLRSTNSYKRFYAPRYFIKNPGYRRPKKLPEGGIFNMKWIPFILGYHDNEILAIAGYDGLVYLSIFQFGSRLFLILTLLMFAIVLPVNWTGDLVDKNQANAKTDKNSIDSTEFDKVTMANVEEKSDTLWVHLVAVYIVTFVTLGMLLKYHHKALELRIEYLSATKKGEQSHTIFVTDIPGVRFGHPLDRLMNSFIFKLLPGSVRQKIISTIDKMTNVATSGVTAIGDMASSAVERSSRALIDDGTSQVALLDQADENSLSTFVRPIPDEITDMNPGEWMREHLAQGMTHEEVIELMYKEVFPKGEVCCANTIVNTSQLEPLVKKLRSAVQKLEDLLDQYSIDVKNDNKIKRRMTRLVPIAEGSWAVEKYGQKPLKIDTMDYLVSKIRALKPLILEADGRAKSEVTGSAFVVFNSRWSQVVGASAFFHHFESVWNAQAAPNPKEIVWENLKWRSWERFARTLLIWFLFFLLCCFFLIPIAVIQALIEVDKLKKYAVIGDIIKFPIVESLVTAILPNLVLEIFLALLPMILRIMNHYQGFISRSAIDTEVTRKYFIFLITTVFIANFGARSLLSQIDLIKDEPSKFVDALASGAPQSSTFFLYFVLTNALISGAADFVNIPGLVLTWLFSKIAGTQRAKDRVWQSAPLQFGSTVSRHTLTFFLGIVFAVVNPLILPVELLYFLLMTMYNRYKLIYVYSEDYQSGGEVWNQVKAHFS